MQISGLGLGKKSLQRLCCRLVFSHDNKHLAIANDEEVKLWNIPSGKYMHTFSMARRSFVVGHREMDLVFSKDSKCVFMIMGGILTSWDIGTGEIQQQIHIHVRNAAKPAFSQDGMYCATLENSPLSQLEEKQPRIVNIWELERAKRLQTLELNVGEVTKIVLSPEAKYLVLIHDQENRDNYSIRAWELSTGESWQIFPDLIFLPSAPISFSRDESLLVCGLPSGYLGIWNISSEEFFYVVPGHTEKAWEVVISPDKRLLASTTSDGTIKISSVSEHEQSSSEESAVSLGHIPYVGFSPNSKCVVSACRWRGIVECWDSESGQKMHRFNVGTIDPLTIIERCINFSYDNSFLAALTKGNRVEIWNVFTGRRVQKLEVPAWDAKSGGLATPRKIAFSHKCDRLAITNSAHGLDIWDILSGVEVHASQELAQSHKRGIELLVFSNEDKLIASCSKDWIVKIWDASTAVVLQTLDGHTGSVVATQFSSDDNFLASGSNDERIRIWAVSSGECVRTLSGHNWPVLSVAFSGSGQYLASASWDQSIRVWNIEDGICSQKIDIDRTVYRLSFESTSSYLHTEFGAFIGDVAAPPQAHTTKPCQRGYGMSSDLSWITHDSKRLLWLPPDYRPGGSWTEGKAVDVNESVVIMRCDSGQTLIFNFVDSSELHNHLTPGRQVARFGVPH